MRQLVAPVALALVVAAPSMSRAQCLGDFNGDDVVSIAELVTAVDNALYGCSTTDQRFVDSGDGTVTDQQTHLMWEKKDHLDGDANPADPHDADNFYSWSNDIPGNADTAPDGTAFTIFLAALNGGTSADGKTTVGCFAGHCDWRLPTVEELNGIRGLTPGTCEFGGCACPDLSPGSKQQSQCCPCIDPVFGPTLSSLYWSLSSYLNDHDVQGPNNAWCVGFDDGSVVIVSKCNSLPVRAVRGGP